MARIIQVRDIHPQRPRRETKDGFVHLVYPVCTVEVTIGLTPNDVRLIETNRRGDRRRRDCLRQLFGPAKGWRFSHEAQRLIASHDTYDNRYQTGVPALIAQRTLASVQQALAEMTCPT